MPYHKNKQQAFQAAQQGYNEARGAFEGIEEASSDYGNHLKHLKQEINEAYQQISNALETASENQRDQLAQFKNDLDQIVDQVKD